jgi:hypothetical protein
MSHPTSNEKNRSLVMEHLHFFKRNLNPLDKKGNEYQRLHYVIEDHKILIDFFDALLMNNSYKGELIIDSIYYDDNIGYKISEIIKNNNLTKLKIGNRSKPFSDRISKMIGEALENNTNLKSLEIFLNIESLSPLHICKFLKNPDSNLENFCYLKLNKSLFEYFSKYLSKKSKLKTLGFYYEPLKYIDLLYESSVDKETYHNLADQIQNDSNILQVNVIPLFEDYQADINTKLTEDIHELKETLSFSCEINKTEMLKDINIEKTYEEENRKMSSIMYK